MKTHVKSKGSWFSKQHKIGLRKLITLDQGLLKETGHATPFLWEMELEADFVDKNYVT